MHTGDFYKCPDRNWYYRVISKLNEPKNEMDYNWLFCFMDLDKMEFYKDRRNVGFFTDMLEKVYDQKEIARLEDIYQKYGRESLVASSGGSFFIDWANNVLDAHNEYKFKVTFDFVEPK